MKKFISIITAIIAISLPLEAFASTWNIDTEHSNIGFKVKHLMVSNVKGAFEKHHGVVAIDDKNITNSKVEISIETGSINTNVQKRDEHLRSSDFFDVAKYPVMTFKSNKIRKGANGKLKVAGELTIHGVTKPVVLDVEPISKEIKDPWGNIRRGTTATTKINRKDFGLTWNAALETGGVVVGDEVLITLEIEMIKKQD